MKLSRIAFGSLFIALFTTFANSSFAGTKDHDGEIIAYMEAINTHEIDVSKVVKDKEVDKQTLDYAGMMISQHDENLQKVKDISSKINVAADETTAVEKFKVKGDKDLEKLSDLNGKKFQNAYIKAMIKGHSNVDKMLTKFEKEVKNPDLKEYLINTKTVVEQHLAEAKQLK
jgi:putative membrane protein